MAVASSAIRCLLAFILCFVGVSIREADDDSDDMALARDLSYTNPLSNGFYLNPYFTSSIGSYSPGSDATKAGRVNIDGVVYWTGPITPVTRASIVPYEGDSFPEFYCYVKFATDVNGNAAPLKIGGYMYFMNAKMTQVGQPMREIRVLTIHEKGAFRFDDAVKVEPSEATTKLGAVGAAGGRWFPITIKVLQDQGYSHYTWVNPGELSASGGFVYKKSAEFIMYPMSPDCKEPGATTYDNWVSNPKMFASAAKTDGELAEVAKQTGSVTVGPTTLLLVIDMQNDFVELNFKQPCNHKQDYLTAGISDLIGKFKAKKGSVIASMDYHPPTHCSFKGSGCTNELHVTDADKANNRYNNPFPPHTLFDFQADDEGSPSYPRFGALLNGRIAGAMYAAAEAAQAENDPARVQLIFKGFHETRESFSAMPHLNSAGAAEAGTGGYALKEVYTPLTCYSSSPPESCFPTRKQINDPSTWMRRADHVVGERVDEKSITDIIVVGLVHDFCVKETAIYAEEFVKQKFKSKSAQKPRVSILMDYARPAFEGKPIPAFHLGDDFHNKDVARDLASKDVKYLTLSQLVFA